MLHLFKVLSLGSKTNGIGKRIACRFHLPVASALKKAAMGFLFDMSSTMVSATHLIHKTKVVFHYHSPDDPIKLAVFQQHALRYFKCKKKSNEKCFQVVHFMRRDEKVIHFEHKRE